MKVDYELVILILKDFMHSNNGIICAVFDLDGTLVQSHTNIYEATVQTLKDLKINYTLPPNEFYKYLGHHFEDIFKVFGIVVPDFEIFIEQYKKNYFAFINYSNLYPGVEEILKSLIEKKIKIALLTTKGQDQAEKILEYFGIDNCFDEIMGRRPGIAHKPSPEPLKLICDKLEVHPSNTLMIGDTELDINCGRNAGSKTCAVTYGYREKEILVNEKPDFIIDNLKELMKLF